jgi:glyoxylase-like metal-dependent hydrolase (beta-lactamase superfamily II)
MITVKTLVFNPFQVNTYLLFDETGECIIIDPACMDEYEEKQLSEFIEIQKLRIVRLLNTHAHIDHIAGDKFVSEKYKIGLEVHKESLSFIRSAKGHASTFGFDNFETLEPSAFINEGDIIKFGQSELKVLYTPGHADGSVCFYSEKEKFVIVGDVLFKGSIGRTDLPSGNHKLLIENIKNKLLVLPESTLVYPGHGPYTTIKHEKNHNPFLVSE